MSIQSKLLKSFSSLFLVGACLSAQADYSNHARTQEFIQEAVEEYNLDAEKVKHWLAQAEKKQSVLDAIAKPAERTIEWDRYQDIFLTEKRIADGKKFLVEYKDLLEQAEEKYGVEKEIIAAIIGVETFYGTRQGSYRVLDSLSTLAFDYPTRPLFWRELKAFFALAIEEDLDLANIKGSYAGAMGYGQFIPTSYLMYAVDGDNDGKRDLLNNPTDAIFSVANYFKRHGWKHGEPVTQPVTVKGNKYKDIVNDNLKPKWTAGELKKMGVKPSIKIDKDRPANLIELQGKQGTEYWLGENNFYVITRYNHSRLYAMAVYQLSEALR